jgi:hypothetical protein
MVAMATWEDGPEYAPLNRPDAFTEPSTPPLSFAPPLEQLTADAPKERPEFADPPEPVEPLANLIPPVEPPRDPAIPFEVLSTALTSADSAWGAAHWTSPASQPAGPTVRQVPGPAPASWPAPTEPLPPVVGPPPNTNGFPAPGTTEWFAPAPYRQPSAPASVTARQLFETATPGVCICLLIGGLVTLVSPIMLAVAFGLSSRIQVASTQIRRTFTTALSILGVVAVLGLFAGATSFSDWWRSVSLWSLVINWVTMVVVLVLVHRGLKRRSGRDQFGPRSPWG